MKEITWIFKKKELTEELMYGYSMKRMGNIVFGMADPLTRNIFINLSVLNEKNLIETIEHEVIHIAGVMYGSYGEEKAIRTMQEWSR